MKRKRERVIERGGGIRELYIVSRLLAVYLIFTLEMFPSLRHKIKKYECLSILVHSSCQS